MAVEQQRHLEQRRAAGQLSRRRFLRQVLGLGLSAGAVSTVLAACGGTAATPTTGAAPSTTSTSAAASTSSSASTSSASTTTAAASAASSTSAATTSASSSAAATSAGTTTAASSAGGSASPAAKLGPLSSTKITFKVAVLQNEFVTDFATNEFTKWYEGQTNVHLDWQIIPSQDAQNKVNVMLASGDFPDILLGLSNYITPAVQQLYGAQGIFVPLNKWIDQYGVYTKQMFADYPLAKTAITAADGNIYAMPQVNVCYHCSMSQKLWINQKWLDKLSLQMPTTTDELTQVLTAFKTKDPNGDGQADEIPLTGCNNSWQTSPDYFLMNSFIFDPGGERLIAKDGKVTAIYAQPEWQAGLKYMHSLYQQGLLAETLFTQGRDQLLQLMNKPDPQLVGAVPAGAPGTFMSTPVDANARWRDFAAVPPLKGPQGVQLAAYNPYQPFILGNFLVTKACKQPDIAFRWCDGLYEREATLRSVIGVLGKDWRWAQPGEVGTDGKPAIWANLRTSDKPDNDAWRQTGPSYRSSALFLGTAQEQGGPVNMEVFLYKQTMEKYEPHKEDIKMYLPPLYFSTDQAQQVAELAATIDPYVTQALANFVTGKLDTDKDWQNYLSTLNSMGLPQYLQANQAAYDKAPKS